MTPDPEAVTLADAMAAVGDGKVAILVGAEGPGLSRQGDAGERHAGADSDVAGHRLAERRDSCGAGVLREG